MEWDSASGVTKTSGNPLTVRGASVESFLDDPSVHPQQPGDDDRVTYEFVRNGGYDGAERGQRKLGDCRGYIFSVQRRRGDVVDWQSLVRPKINLCKAKVRRRTKSFEPGPQGHNHPAQVGATIAAKVVRLVKSKTKDVFRPAPAIVDEVYLEELTNAPCPSLPKPEYLAKQANRLRQKLRPSDPKNLAFDLEEEHIPLVF